MNADKNYVELFERYQNGLMTSFEEAAFSARLESDADFAEAFEIFKELDKALIEEELLKFKAYLEEIHNETKSEWSVASPMMIEQDDEIDEIDQAILDQDIISLRDKLEKIHHEIDDEIETTDVPAYQGIERAVADQDAIDLRKELERFNESLDQAHAPVINEDERLELEVNHAIMDDRIISFRNKLGEIASEVIPEPKVIPLFKKITMKPAAAAAIALLVLATGLFSILKINDPISPRSAERKYFSIEYSGVSRGAMSMESANYQDVAMRLMREGKFELAVEKFVEMETMSEYDIPVTWFYHAMALRNIGEYLSAEQYFQKTIKHDNNTWVSQAKWQSILNCIYRKDIDEAIRRANEYAITYSDKKEQAYELIAKLD